MLSYIKGHISEAVLWGVELFWVPCFPEKHKQEWERSRSLILYWFRSRRKKSLLQVVASVEDIFDQNGKLYTSLSLIPSINDHYFCSIPSKGLTRLWNQLLNSNNFFVQGLPFSCTIHLFILIIVYKCHYVYKY